MSIMKNYLQVIFILASVYDCFVNCASSSSRREKSKIYGCSYDDPEELSMDGPVLNPKFGEDVDALQLDSMDEFKDLHSIISDLNQEVITTEPYNSMNDFIRFYREFGDSEVDCITDYFLAYKIKLGSVQSPVSQSLSLMKKITNNFEERYPNIEKNMFIAGTYTGETKASLDILDSNEFSLNDQCFPSAVGILKISFGNRVGFIILYPSLGVIVPVVMVDEYFPHLGCQSYNSKLYSFKISSGLKYIYAHKCTRGMAELSSLQPNSPVDMIIYIEDSYCSVLDTTEKYSLLNKYLRGVMIRNAEGSPSFGVHFHVAFKKEMNRPSVPESQKVKYIMFYVDPYDNQFKTAELPFLDTLTQDLETINDTFKLPARAIEQNIDIEYHWPNVKNEPNPLLSNLAYVGFIMEDKDFMEKYDELAKSYFNDEHPHRCVAPKKTFKKSLKILAKEAKALKKLAKEAKEEESLNGQ